MLKFWFS